ncbi:unnamed protein product [Mortierella alpina]
MPFCSTVRIRNHAPNSKNVTAHTPLAKLPAASTLVQRRCRLYSTTPTGVPDDTDCPELPSTPSWSLSSIMERRDRLSTSPDHSDDITPKTIDHLLKLAHLCKPTDPDELQRLVRDVRRMKNFLDYIQSCDTQHQRLTTDPAKPVESLRSLVDDGFGLEMRLDRSPADEDVNAGSKEQRDREAVRRRDVLLERPNRVKGNFFVVGTELDPKDSN